MEEAGEGFEGEAGAGAARGVSVGIEGVDGEESVDGEGRDGGRGVREGMEEGGVGLGARLADWAEAGAGGGLFRVTDDEDDVVGEVVGD